MIPCSEAIYVEFLKADISRIELEHDGRRRWTLSSWRGELTPAGIGSALAWSYKTWGEFQACVCGVQIVSVDAVAIRNHLAANGFQEFSSVVQGAPDISVGDIVCSGMEMELDDFVRVVAFSIDGQCYVFTNEWYD